MTAQLRTWNWPIFFMIFFVHVFGVILPWFFFSWIGVVAFFVAYFCVGLGITLGYHRLLTHNGFKTYGWVQGIFTLLGMAAIQGSPLKWISDHRKHHKFSDREGDPHSPRDGFLHAHMLWTWISTPAGHGYHYAKKEKGDKFLARCSIPKVYFGFVLLTFLLLFGVGCLIGWFTEGPWWYMGLSVLVYGGFLRVVAGWHATWLVNSWTHLCGYKNYHDTRDNSKNSFFVGVVALGEGWHNNHHHMPRAANHGHRWFELDPTYWVILLLRALRLVWKVKEVRWHPPPDKLSGT